MALDTLDYSVMVALALAILVYFGKDKIWPGDDGTSAGFVANVSAGGHSRDLIETLNKNNKNCIIFYGSQTGTAEDYASKLSKELGSRFGLKPMTVDFADYDFDNFAEISEDVLCFFLMATYGEGEPTDNAIEFFNFLDNEADTLSTLRFSVFGLGNSTYEFYNAIGKKTNERLQELGAERLSAYGEGDDGLGTMDEDFLSWKDLVIDSLKNNLNFEEHEAVYQPSLNLIESVHSIDDAVVSHGEPNSAYVSNSVDLSKGPFDHAHPFLSKVVKTQELFNSKTRSCVHAEFDLSGTNLRYSTGDHLAIWPSNANENIEKFLEAFDLYDKTDNVFELKAADSTVAIPFHTPITYGAVVRHHLEISGDVSRQFLLSIAQFAPDEETKKEALRLGNSKELFATEIHEKCYNMADALLKISDGKPWNNVPFEFIVESVPHLQARYYSISSSSLSEKTAIHVTAVVESEKIGNQLVTGVVTNLLKNIEIEQNNKTDKPTVTYDLKGPRNKFSNYKLPVHVRRSTFKLPSNPSTPIICIGPGTGIAPFRGFIREKVSQIKTNNATIGKVMLFYGCRSEDEDYLYKDEWPSYAQALGSQFEMNVAFSRKDPKNKEYVQHKLLENAEQINSLLNDGAFIYVCGDASKMARDVQSTLTKIIAKGRNISDEKSAELIRSLKTQNKFQEDVW